MPRFDRETLQKVTVYIAEKNYYERQELRDLFAAQGLKQIVCHSSMDALRDMLFEVPPDLLVVSDDFDNGVFDLIKEIRQQKIGDNPFMLITVLVSNTRREALKAAMGAGVDDIIVKPLTAEKVLERLKLVTFHRQPFVATDEYLGPYRKAVERAPTVLRRIPVVNTMLEKVNGHTMDKFELKAAVEGSLQKVLQAQLDSQSFRLGQVCERVVHAYDTGRIDDVVQSDLDVLANVLSDASGLARRLKDEQLADMCVALAESVNGIADHYTDPSIKEIDLIRKITDAFKMAMKPVEAGEGEVGALDLSQFAAPN